MGLFKTPPYIDSFQLENLIRGLIGFHFFNLCKKNPELPERWSWMVQRAQVLEPHQAMEHILKSCPDLSSPIVLICEKGRRSGQIALRLEKKHYLNVYALKGGVKGLESGNQQ